MMNLYQILGVPRDASQQEIKRAYYGLARKTHPDYYGDAYLSTFKKICLAYEILSNSQRRAVYDQHIRPPASMLDLLNTEAGKKLLSVILPHAPAARREGEDLLVVLEETDNGCVELSDPLCLDQALRIPIGTSHVFCRVAHRGAPGHGGGAAGRLFILPTRTRKKKG